MLKIMKTKGIFWQLVGGTFILLLLFYLLTTSHRWVRFCNVYNGCQRSFDEEILLQNLATDCKFADSLTSNDLIRLSESGECCTFVQYKRKKAKDFLTKHSRPPKGNLAPLPEIKPKPVELAKEKVHNYTEKMDLMGLENELRREKKMRLALGDTDVLQLPEVVKELKQSKYKVPNIVHFVYFGCTELNLDTYQAMMGAFRYQNPAIMLYHSDCEPHGPYWDAFKAIAGEKVRVVKRSPPTEVWGINVQVIQHKSDVARMQILLEVGGMYLDMDSLVLRSFDKLRQFDITLGEEDTYTVENSIIIASRDSWFLKRWYWEYRYFRDDVWALNSCIMAWSLWRLFPSTVNVVPMKISRPNWMELEYIYEALIDWDDFYSVHLYSRQYPKKTEGKDILKELAVLRTTYGEFARHVMWGDKAVRDVTEWLVTCNITEMLIRDWNDTLH